MSSGAQCLNRVWLPAANCQCTDDARIDALWRSGVRSACLSWSRRTPNGATGERQIQGFSPQRHKDTKEHKGRAVVFSLSPCLPVSSSVFPVRLKARYLHDEGTKYLHDDWWDRYLHDSRAGSTGVTRHTGLTGVFPESGALIGLGWAALAQVLRAIRESAPAGLASAAGAAGITS